jgi:arginyl-tRNA synthetase
VRFLVDDTRADALAGGAAESTRQVLKNALALLGVSAPEKM